MIKRVCQVVTAVGLMLAAALPIKAEEILLKKISGVYHVPLSINNVLTRDFVIDTGAAEVVVSEDVVASLIKSGTLKQTNYLPRQTFVLANGSRVNFPRVILNRITVGNLTVRNVPAVIVKKKGALLLGQSFLSRLGTWSLDNRRRVLIVEESSAPRESTLPVQRQPSPQRPSSQTTASEPSVIARQYFKEGLNLQKTGKIAASIQAYTQSIRAYPTALAYVSRSSANLALKAYESAEMDASQAIRLAPKVARSYNNRAYARINLGNYSGAISDASEAIRLNPEDGYAYAHRAIAHTRAGDHRAAIQDFQRSANLFLDQGNTTMHRKVINLMAMVQSNPR